MRRTRKSKGGYQYPFVGRAYNTYNNSNYYANNVNPLIFSSSSRAAFGGKRRKKRTRRYAGGWLDDRFSFVSAPRLMYEQSLNFIRMTQGKGLENVGNPISQPIHNY